MLLNEGTLGTDVLAPISFLPRWDDAAQCQAFDLIRGLIEILVPFTTVGHVPGTPSHRAEGSRDDQGSAESLVKGVIAFSDTSGSDHVYQHPAYAVTSPPGPFASDRRE